MVISAPLRILLRPIGAALVFATMVSIGLGHSVGPPSALALAHADIVARVQAKLAAGEDTADAVAPELAELDALVAGAPAENAHDAGDALVSRLAFTIELLDDPAATLGLMQRLQSEFPENDTGPALVEALARKEERRAAQAAKAALIGQPAPRLTFRWASQTGLASLEDLRGHVVLLEFWATGSAPSVRAQPALRRLAARYAGRPFTILGVTGLHGAVTGLGPAPIATGGDAARELALLGDYAREKDLPWPIAVPDEGIDFLHAFAAPRVPYRVLIAPDGTVRAVGVTLEELPALIDGLVGP